VPVAVGRKGLAGPGTGQPVPVALSREVMVSAVDLLFCHHLAFNLKVGFLCWEGKRLFCSLCRKIKGVRRRRMLSRSSAFCK